MEEVEEVNFFLWTELYALYFYDLTLVLPQTYVDDAASGIQEANYCFGEVELDGVVFKWPSVILALLIGRFAELANNTRRIMLKDQSAADQFFILALRGFSIFFDPIECHLIKEVIGTLQ